MVTSYFVCHFSKYGVMMSLSLSLSLSHTHTHTHTHARTYTLALLIRCLQAPKLNPSPIFSLSQIGQKVLCRILHALLVYHNALASLQLLFHLTQGWHCCYPSQNSLVLLLALYFRLCLPYQLRQRHPSALPGLESFHDQDLSDHRLLHVSITIRISTLEYRHTVLLDLSSITPSLMHKVEACYNQCSSSENNSDGVEEQGLEV
jgi:hypothetical protein